MNLILFVYIAIIIFLHIIPLGEGGTSRFDLGPLRADYFLHALVFTPWMFLVYLARPKRAGSGNIKVNQSRNSRQARGIFTWIKERKALSPGAFLVWVFIGISMAFGAESIQYWLNYREYNPMDAMFNSLGVLIGAALLYKVQRSKFNVQRWKN
jgi:hypothetical protein